MGLNYPIKVIIVDLYLTHALCFVLIKHKTGWLASFHLNSVQRYHKLGFWCQGEGGHMIKFSY